MHEHIDFVSSSLKGYRVFKSRDELSAAEAASIRAVVVAGEVELDHSVIATLPNLKLIACLTAGYDGVDIEWARSRGLLVTHAICVNHEEVADHVVAVLLAWHRGILSGDSAVRNGGWRGEEKIVTRSTEGRTLGIVGMGAVGRAVARRCADLRMHVLWWGPNAKPDIGFEQTSDVLSLAERSDVLVIASKADKSNTHLIDGEVLDCLGKEGLLINVARGSLLDERALIDRLESGKLGGAALDVFEREPTPSTKWSGVPNVILTPHTAGATNVVLPKLIHQLQENLDALSHGEELVSPVSM